MAENKKRTRAARRKSAYGAPSEEREVVVTVDKRLLFGASLVIVFGLALGISMISADDGASNPVTANAPGVAANAPQQPAAGQSANPVQQQLGSMTDEEIRAQMQAAGLDPNSAQVVGEGQYNIPQQQQSQPVPVDPMASQQEDSPQRVLEEMADENPELRAPIEDISPQAQQSAQNWTHDVLAGVQDPNVMNEEFKVFRPEILDEPLEGPRLGVKGLNMVNTFDFGKVPFREIARRDLMLQNVGDEDLVISRVYSGCGCTAPRIGDVQLDNAGFLPEPMTLAPGEEVEFTVEFDPQLSKETGAQAKWIQIFSNDSSKAMFDPTDPLSHETRFRIVVQPVIGLESSDSPSG